MYRRLNTRKAAQAAAALLRTEPNDRMAYIRLLKLLYIADRDQVAKTGMPILGSRPVAMAYGPLHSEVYNLVQGEHEDVSLWSSFIRTDRYCVELQEDPGVDELSRSELRTLNSVARQYEDTDDFDIAERTHDFPEWKANFRGDGTSTTIPFEDMLAGLGIEGADAEAIKSEWSQFVRDERTLRCPLDVE